MKCQGDVDRTVYERRASSRVSGVLDLDVDADVTPLAGDCHTDFGVNEWAVGWYPEAHFETVGIAGFCEQSSGAFGIVLDEPSVLPMRCALFVTGVGVRSVCPNLRGCCC